MILKNIKHRSQTLVVVGEITKPYLPRKPFFLPNTWEERKLLKIGYVVKTENNSLKRLQMNKQIVLLFESITFSL